MAVIAGRAPSRRWLVIIINFYVLFLFFVKDKDFLQAIASLSLSHLFVLKRKKVRERESVEMLERQVREREQKENERLLVPREVEKVRERERVLNRWKGR